MMATEGPLLELGDTHLDLGHTRVMGVLNVTPDSFSDGGRFLEYNRAIEHAHALVEEGAELLDVGGESTRPGAAPVELAEELQRVIPVVEALATELTIPISVDTRKSVVMRAAVAAGAKMINDVSALRYDPEALTAVVELRVPVCLMHMQGQPETMQQAPYYADVVDEVQGFLAERTRTCQAAGLPKDRIILDPGVGFGKTQTHNLTLLHHLSAFRRLGFPLLVGTSRKAMIHEVLGQRHPGERVYGTAATVAWAVAQGVGIVRVHDVAAMVDVVRTIEAILHS